MRVASRIIGGTLIFCGLCFLGLAIAFFVSLIPGRLVGLFPLALGVGSLLAGRYYLRLDVNAPEEPEPPPWGYAPYVAAHRRELGVLAQAGLVISLVRFGALCFGWDSPRWTDWIITAGGAGVLFLSPKAPSSMPKWARYLVGAWSYALYLYILIAVWRYWSGPHVPLDSRLIGSGFVVLLYGSAAVSCTYAGRGGLEQTTKSP